MIHGIYIIKSHGHVWFVFPPMKSWNLHRMFLLMIQLVPRIPQRDSQRSTARFIDVGLNATTAEKITGEMMKYISQMFKRHEKMIKYS